MRSKKPTGTRRVVVDIPMHDVHGKPITDDMLSSGGARRPAGSGDGAGSIISQYANPQSYENATREEADREFYASLDREYEAERRRVEHDAQVERDRRNAEIVDAVDQFLRAEVYPRIAKWWRASGPDDLKRLGRWVTTPLRRRKGEDVLTSAEPAPLLVAEVDVEDDFRSVAPITFSAPNEDTTPEPANVVRMDDFREKRSA